MISIFWRQCQRHVYVRKEHEMQMELLDNVVGDVDERFFLTNGLLKSHFSELEVEKRRTCVSLKKIKEFCYQSYLFTLRQQHRWFMVHFIELNGLPTKVSDREFKTKVMPFLCLRQQAHLFIKMFLFHLLYFTEFQVKSSTGPFWPTDPCTLLYFKI